MDHKGSKRRGRKKGKVKPETDSEELINEGFEMSSVEDEKINNKNLLRKLKVAAKMTGHINKNNNPINIIANIRQGASRWKRYATSKRKSKSQDADVHGTRRTGGGMGLGYEISEDSYDTVDGHHISATQKQVMASQNRNLIEYFARLGSTLKEEEDLNLDYIDSLLKSGACIGCTDKYGQSVLHEAARSWHVDVAKFLIEQGANVSQADNYGRTPLHIAAAVDYPEMVDFLIENNADKEAQTKGELQTPVHFASRNDACDSLKALVKAGCRYKDIRDYKGRTPLHLAAELDRSETARLLMELDDPAPAGVEDKSGQSAIVWMITKMPPVARLALDQFHTTDRANRKQYFHLHCLEPRKPGVIFTTFPQTALSVIVLYKQYELVTHPVVSKLIEVKWRKFGKFGAILNLMINIVFILTWTALGIIVPYDIRYKYELPHQWYRILLFLLALVFSAWQLKEELTEFFTSKKNHSNWKQWRENEIQKDIEYTHPRWPEEEQYLNQEMEDLDSQSPQYFNDFWNIFDWICYTLLLLSILTHLIDVVYHTEFIARFHIRVMAITIILIWLRLMKNARAFSTLGPFIVMISHMFGDVIRFAFLYLEFYIPYACAFWMLFGGDKVPAEFQGLPDANNNTIKVGGMQDANALLFSLFRLTLVDEYDYDGMKSVDSIMADILIGTWLALSAILMLNIFIALLSDTFQRVYDNAQANAVMQKAITILSSEDSMSFKRREKFRAFIHASCAPLMDFYDDDATDPNSEDLKKVTIQIKEELDEFREMWENHNGIGPKNTNEVQHTRHGRLPTKPREELDDLSDLVRDHYETFDNESGNNRRNRDSLNGPLTRDRFETELDSLREEIRGVADRQEELTERVRKDMSSIKRLLQQIANTQTGGTAGGVMPMSAPLLGSVPGTGRSISMDTVDTGFMQRSISRTSSHRGRSEDEWEKVEKRRKRELRKLREQLAQQQQHIAAQTTEEQEDDPNIVSVRPLTVEVAEAKQQDTAAETQESALSTGELEPALIIKGSRNNQNTSEA